MPRSGTFVYSLPPGVPGQKPNETIQSAWANDFSGDVELAFNTAWPVSLGGTGGTNPATARTALDVPSTAEVATSLVGFANRVINGNFDIWQRGGVSGALALASGQYGPDRWVHSRDGSGATVTIQRVPFTLGQTAVPRSKYYARLQQTVAGSGATFSNFGQRIEGVETFAGETITITLYLQTPSAFVLPGLSIVQNFGTGGSPSSSVAVTVASSIAITTGFQKLTYTVTVPSITGKTLGTNGNDFLAMFIGLPINAAWTLNIAHVSIVGGDATGQTDPFSPRPLQQELALCQRYYQRVTAFERWRATAAESHETTVYFNPMRSAPAASSTSPGTSLNIASETVTTASSASYNSFRWSIPSSAAGDAYVLDKTFELDAEL